MTNLRAGAQLYSIRSLTQNPIDMDESFRQIAEMGYSIVEVSGQASFITPNQMHDCAKRHGLNIYSSHVSFEKIRSDTDSIIQIHRVLGCKYVCINKMPEYYRRSREGILAFARDAALCARKLADAGFTLVYHHMLFEFAPVEGVPAIELLLDNTPDELKFEPDTYWLQLGGYDPAAFIRRLDSRVPLVHFKDLTVSPFETPEMAPFGAGNLNWPDILDACAHSHVLHAFIEQDNAIASSPLACMRISAENARKMGIL